MSGDEDRNVYRSYFERSPVAVFVVNHGGTYIDANPAACNMIGYSRDELLSMTITDLGVGEQVSEDDPTFQTLKDEGRLRTNESLRHRDGHEIDVLFDAVTLCEDRFIVYCHDITKQREYEQQLQEQRDSLEVLNQVVRHDLRNDMTVLRGRATLLEEYVDPDGISDLKAIQEATERAIELTNTARDLSETMLSTDEDIQPVRLDRHLKAPVTKAASKFDYATITTDGQIPDVQVQGNDLLEAVFRNIIENGVAHNDKEEPELHISMTIESETITVVIADNGPGVSDNHKQVIFGKGEKSLDSSGAGIGLYLVETLVNQYGGDVWVEDNDPEGAIFNVKLPIIS